MIEKKKIIKIIKILLKESEKFKKPVVEKLYADEKDPYKILITTLISLRTKDSITEEVSKKVLQKASNPYVMAKLPLHTIEKIVKKAGFYKNKAMVIKNVSKKIIEDYNGRVPDKPEELLKIKGVGHKTANLVLSTAYGKNFICVDTHVHRISNRLGLVKTKNPYDTEIELMKVLPKKYWKIINQLFVTWGQNICKPINPKCSICSVEAYCEKNIQNIKG